MGTDENPVGIPAVERDRPDALAVCAIFQDEARYLAEWIEFHLLMGVEHFVLYDNDSEDGPEAVLGPYIDAGLVTLVPWPHSFEEFAQIKAYNHCLETFGARFRWIAMIDVDEFLFAPDGRPLGQVLADFPDVPAVVVHWQVYGSSGHVEAPDGLVIEQFTRRAPTSWVRNRRLKSIVDPRRTQAFVSPHFALYRDGARAVSENGVPCTVRFRNRAHASRLMVTWRRLLNGIGRRLIGRFPMLPWDPFNWTPHNLRTVSVDRLRINHYAVKSLNQYRDRTRRRRIPGQVGSGRRVHNAVRFRYHDRNEVEDPVLKRWAEEVRRNLASRRR